ncbi:MAG: HAMP domain-containing histidine kinase, partial [Opitutaceae bacterium]|nr:HAMP domain-containing histidine kinase [Opitutaceae bacterium]
AEYQRVDLLQVARDVREVIFFNNLAIKIHGLAEAPVRGSSFELMRIFQNLFKNALEAGATELEMRVTQGAGTYEVTVADNGAGMSSEALKQALRGGFTSKATGTGLGLNICRHLLAAHGAVLTIDSAVGKGTTVRIVFPVAKA